MKKLSVLLVILLSSCMAGQISFTTLQQAQTKDYGYSINKPIMIGIHQSWQRNTELAFYMLSKLKYNGNPLKFVMHASISKPKDQPRSNKSLVPYRYAYSGCTGGEVLDMFVMVPEGTTDTLELYFDVEIAGSLQIPADMEFDHSLNNNIYR